MPFLRYHGPPNLKGHAMTDTATAGSPSGGKPPPQAGTPPVVWLKFRRVPPELLTLDGWAQDATSFGGSPYIDADVVRELVEAAAAALTRITHRDECLNLPAGTCNCEAVRLRTALAKVKEVQS